MTGCTYPDAALDQEWLRSGPYRIAKAHIEGRQYVAVVLDMRKPVGERKVYRATRDGWSRRMRAECRGWIVEQVKRGA